MKTKEVTEKRNVNVCDMCEETELTCDDNVPIGDTCRRLHYQVVKAFKNEGEVQETVKYQEFPNNTVFIEQRKDWGKPDRFCLCYTCYDKLMTIIETDNGKRPLTPKENKLG